MSNRTLVASTATLVLLAALPSRARAQDTTRVRDTTTVRDTTSRPDSMRVNRAQAVRDSIARLDSLRAINNPQSDSALTRATEYSPTRTAGQVRSPRVRSDIQIPIRKESGGEVDLHSDQADSVARADSIARAMEQARMDSVARVDSMRRDSIATVERARADSIAAAEKVRQDSIDAVMRARNDSIARADSITRAEEARQQRIRDRYLFNGSGWYVGLSGGSAMPAGDFEKLGYDNGFAVGVPIGWHSRSNFLGLRLDLGYSQFNGGSVTGTGSAPVTLSNSDPKILSAVLNLTARVPLNGSHTVNLYGLGGGGVFHFRDFGRASGLAAFLGDEVIPVTNASDATRNEFGTQLGAGIDFGVGPASLYVESRLVNVFSRRDDDADFANVFGGGYGKDVRWVPIMLGVTFR